MVTVSLEGAESVTVNAALVVPVSPSVTVTSLMLSVRASKVAVTDRAASIVTTQGPELVQAPAQVVNDDPIAGEGESVTSVPWS
jgi:hypothetical protein